MTVNPSDSTFVQPIESAEIRSNNAPSLEQTTCQISLNLLQQDPILEAAEVRERLISDETNSRTETEESIEECTQRALHSSTATKDALIENPVIGRLIPSPRLSHQQPTSDQTLLQNLSSELPIEKRIALIQYLAQNSSFVDELIDKLPKLNLHDAPLEQRLEIISLCVEKDIMLKLMFAGELFVTLGCSDELTQCESLNLFLEKADPLLKKYDWIAPCIQLCVSKAKFIDDLAMLPLGERIATLADSIARIESKEIPNLNGKAVAFILDNFAKLFTESLKALPLQERLEHCADIIRQLGSLGEQRLIYHLDELGIFELVAEHLQKQEYDSIKELLHGREWIGEGLKDNLFRLNLRDYITNPRDPSNFSSTVQFITDLSAFGSWAMQGINESRLLYDVARAVANMDSFVEQMNAIALIVDLPWGADFLNKHGSSLGLIEKLEYSNYIEIDTSDRFNREFKVLQFERLERVVQLAGKGAWAVTLLERNISSIGFIKDLDECRDFESRISCLKHVSEKLSSWSLNPWDENVLPAFERDLRGAFDRDRISEIYDCLKELSECAHLSLETILGEYSLTSALKTCRSLEERIDYFEKIHKLPGGEYHLRPSFSAFIQDFTKIKDVSARLEQVKLIADLGPWIHRTLVKNFEALGFIKDIAKSGFIEELEDFGTLDSADQLPPIFAELDTVAAAGQWAEEALANSVEKLGIIDYLNDIDEFKERIAAVKALCDYAEWLGSGIEDNFTDLGFIEDLNNCANSQECLSQLKEIIESFSWGAEKLVDNLKKLNLDQHLSVADRLEFMRLVLQHDPEIAQTLVLNFGSLQFATDDENDLSLKLSDFILILNTLMQQEVQSSSIFKYILPSFPEPIQRQLALEILKPGHTATNRDIYDFESLDSLTPAFNLLLIHVNDVQEKMKSTGKVPLEITRAMENFTKFLETEDELEILGSVLKEIQTNLKCKGDPILQLKLMQWLAYTAGVYFDLDESQQASLDSRTVGTIYKHANPIERHQLVRQATYSSGQENASEILKKYGIKHDYGVISMYLLSQIIPSSSGLGDLCKKIDGKGLLAKRDNFSVLIQYTLAIASMQPLKPEELDLFVQNMNQIIVGNGNMVFKLQKLLNLAALCDRTTFFQCLTNDTASNSVLLKKFSEAFGFEQTHHFEESYTKTFGSFRNSNAIFAYAKAVSLLPAYERNEVHTVLCSFVKAVMSVDVNKDIVKQRVEVEREFKTFKELRYQIKTQPHLEKVFEHSSQIQTKWSSSLYESPKEFSGAKGKYAIDESDHPCDLLLIGTEIQGSCQHVNKNPRLNKCLVSYMLNGEIKPIVVKDSNGKIVARSIIRLLWDEKNNRPVLLQEPIYPKANLDPAIISEINSHAVKKAESMDLPLVSVAIGAGAPYEGDVAFLGGSTPFTYSDATEQVEDGTRGYKVAGSHFLYQPTVKTV